MKKQNLGNIESNIQPVEEQQKPEPKARKTAPKIVYVQPAKQEYIEDNDSNSEIEQKRAPPKLVKQDTPKPKRTPTEKQIENLQKGRERRDAIRRERIEANKREEEQRQREIEEKIVKKAIQVKKRQIKQQKIIEPDSESEEYEAPPKPILRRYKQVAPPAPPPSPKPKYIIKYV
jgi:ABC-type Fe3+/spermidine/putrescine transport system ATPase subunit